MSENKMGKYFKYAIGEILLVVIGILIALQINNWNENRLQRNEEKIILQNLTKDYKNAIDEFQALNKLRRDFIEASKTIISIKLNEINKYPTTYLDSLFSKTLTAPTYNNKAGSLNVLLTSGKINLISNQALKNMLIEWPGDVADMIEDEISHREIYIGPYSEILEDFLSWNDLVKQYTTSGLRFKQINVQIMPNNPITSSDYNSLLNNKRFLNLLNRRASFCDISNYETEDLIKKAQNIINLIDEELKH